MQPYILFIFFAFLIEKSLQKSVPQTRIFGGKPAVRGQFPYQALLVSLKSACGGTIISNRYVLTAAHCVYDGFTQQFRDLYGIAFGVYDLNKYGTGGVQTLNLENWHKIIVHKDYNNRLRYHNDIALIELPSPINFTDTISPVKLPKRRYNDSYPVGRKVISSGFGRMGGALSPGFDPLYYITSTIVPHDECIKFYVNNYYSDSEMCINMHRMSVCNGDSGGPNVIKDDSGELVVVGITVGAPRRGCTGNYPQVLIRISHYLDWIYEKTGIPIEN